MWPDSTWKERWDDESSVLLDIKPVDTVNQSIVSFARRRELGRFVHPVQSPFKAECSLARVKVQVEVFKGNRVDVVTKPKSLFFPYVGGFLGLSPGGTWLVGISIRRSAGKAYLMLFRCTPKHLRFMLGYSLVLPDVERMSVVQTYFPPNEDFFVPTLLLNQEDVQNSKVDNSISTQAYAHVLLPKYQIHFSLSFVLLVVARVFQKTRLSKNYLRVYEDGFIVNTGISLICISFHREALPVHSGRKTWCFVENAPSVLIDKKLASTSVEVESGETLRIHPMLYKIDRMGRPPAKKYHLMKPHETLAQGLSVAPHMVSRQSLVSETLIDSLVERHLRSAAPFKGAVMKGFVDYETDVMDIVDGVASVSILAVCEVQLLKDDDTIRTEFLLFRLGVNWNLVSGDYHPCRSVFLKKLTHHQAFRNNWFPYSKFPICHNHQIVCRHNYAMYSGRNQSRLSSLYGSLDFICDEEVDEMEFEESTADEFTTDGESSQDDAA